MRHAPLRHETLSFPLQLNVFICLLCFLFIVYYLFKKKKQEKNKKTDIFMFPFGWLKWD